MFTEVSYATSQELKKTLGHSAYVLEGIRSLIGTKSYAMTIRLSLIHIYGSRSEYTFNKYGQQELEKVFLDNFGENDWYGGFEDYIKECSSYLEKAAAGKPVRASLLFPGLIVEMCIRDRSRCIGGRAWCGIRPDICFLGSILSDTGWRNLPDDCWNQGYRAQ